MRWRRAELERAASRDVLKRRRIAWHVTSTERCYWESCGRRSIWPPAERGWGCLLPGEVCMKTGRPVADLLWEKRPDIRVPPVENPMCLAFEEYEEVPETVPLDFSEDNVM